MKNYLLKLTVLILCISSQLFSQWNAMLNIRPNPSPVINNWEHDPSIAVFTVTYNGSTQQDVQFFVKVTEKRKGEMFSANSSSITFPAGPTVQTYTTIDYIDWNNITYNSSAKNVIAQTGKLPEGNYNFCIQIKKGRTVLTEACADFSINLPDHPMLIAPVNNGSILNNYPAFQWTPVITSSDITVKYNLRICEVLRGQTPSKALQANMPVLETEILSSNLYQYSPSDFPLERGKKYVWRIRAVDERNQPLTDNNGNSEIWVFNYAEIKNNKGTDFNPKEKVVHHDEHISNLGFTILKGEIFYQSGEAGDGKATALSNTKIKLMLFQEVGDHIVAALYPATVLLSTTTTDDQGRFTFSFMDTASTRILQKNYDYSTGGEFPTHYHGDLKIVGRIVVENPYFCSPNRDIEFKSGDSRELGTVMTVFKSFHLTVQVKPDQNKKGQVTLSPLKFANVKILRVNRPDGIPYDEGTADTPRKKLGNYEVVSEGETDANGEVKFTRLVTSINESHDSYVLLASTDSTKGKYRYVSTMMSFWEKMGTIYDYRPIFRNEYQPYSKYMTVCLSPAWPRIAGYVYRADNQTQPVKDVTVSVLDMGGSKGFYRERSLVTPANGYFHFNSLEVELNSSGDVIAPIRLLPIESEGFKYELIPVNGQVPLSYGEQYIFEAPILLTPKAKVTGRIVSSDEENTGVHSFVTVGEGAKIETTTKTSMEKKGNLFLPTYSEGWFESPAALEHHQPVLIQPLAGYFPKTEYRGIAKSNLDMGNFYVKKKLHRINLQLRYTVSNAQHTVVTYKPAENLLAGIDNLAPLTYSNSDGDTFLKTFESCGNNFTARIKPSSFSPDWVAKEVPVTNNVSENYCNYMVFVQKASNISGQVLYGKENKPVAYAHVYMIGQSSSEKIETYTDANGNYTLRGIPVGIHSFAAVKGNSSFIGDSLKINCIESGVANVNFHLKVYDGMDITKLLGFQMSVLSLDSTSQGIRISGEFNNLPKDSIFAPGNPNATLDFSNIYIIPSKEKNENGTPLAYPKTLPIRVTNISLPIKIYNVFNGQVSDDDGLSINETSSGSNIGTVQGKVYLDAGTSLQNTQELELSGFYLSSSQTVSTKQKRTTGKKTVSKTNPMILNTLCANGSNMHLSPEKFNVSDVDGKPLQYKYFGFTLSNSVNDSYVLGDTIRLNSSIQGEIEHASPINVLLGDIVLHHNSIENINGNSQIKISLSQKWSIISNKWSLEYGKGFVFNEGKLATGTMDIPFTNMSLYPSSENVFQLVNGNFNLTQLSVGGFLPIRILPSSVQQFGYDASLQCWIFGVASPSDKCASFKSLPGMNATDSVVIGNFRLVSKGNDGFNISSSTPDLTVYKVASFQPTGLTAGPNLVQINGTMDLHLPNSAVKSSALNYSVKNGNITFGFDSFPFFVETNGIYASFQGNSQSSPEEFSDFGFKARGTIKDEKPGTFNWNVWLYKTVDSTSIWLEPNQDFVFTKNGSKKLQNIGGTMRVINQNAWDNFHFGGDLVGATGASGKLRFVVTGDFLPGNQELKLENIDTPFGNLAFILDLENGRLVGNLDIDKDLAGSVHVVGHLSTVIDDKGWYFLGAGDFELKAPTIKLAAAIVFGYYPAISKTAEFQDVFLSDPERYTYNGMIPQYLTQTLSGAYFTGRATIPFPIIPTIDVNLDPVVHCSVTPIVGGFLAVGINFGPSNAYYVNTGAYLGVTAGLGASIGIGCAGASLSGTVVVYGQGEINISSGSWYVEGEGDLILSGSAYVGVGCCDDDCDCLVEAWGVCVCGGCLSDSWSGNIKIPLMKLRLGEGGPKFCAAGLCN